MDANRSSRTRINKKFILNTIDGLKSHNRREEEEDCWRQHRLEQEAQHRLEQEAPTRPTNRRRQHNLDQEVPNRPLVIHVDDERKFWAEKKARAMTSLESAGSHTAPSEHSAVEAESEIRSNEHRKGKKRKRERRIEEAKLRYEDKEGGRPRDDSVDHKESGRKRKKSKKHSKVERKSHKKRRDKR